MNKKIAFSILFLSFFMNEKLAGQTENQTVKIVDFNFSCRGRDKTIPLPSDFIGPQYFSHDEGSIVYFFSVDSAKYKFVSNDSSFCFIPADSTASLSIDNFCIVSIVCAALTDLSLDSSYIPIKIRDDGKDILYYSEKKNKYGRKIYLKRYLVMYEHASTEKKDILDKIINLLKEEEKEINNNKKIYENAVYH